MSQPEWMKKYHQIMGQKAQEGDDTAAAAGGGNTTTTTEQTADAGGAPTTTTDIDPRSTSSAVSTGSEDAAALFFAAGGGGGGAVATPAPAGGEEEIAGNPSSTSMDPNPSVVVADSSSTSADDVIASIEASLPPVTTFPQSEEMSDQDVVGGSWIVDQNQIDKEQEMENVAAAAAATAAQQQQQPVDEEHSPPSSGSVEEEVYVDDYGNEVYEEEEEEYVEEGQEDTGITAGDQYYENELQAQAAVVAASRSRSAQVAPAPPQQDMLPVFNIEEQRKVILSSAKGKRSHMSPAIPIIAFLVLIAAILLVVFLVALKDDDRTRMGPSMAPSMLFLPLEPTNNGNIPSAATTSFDSIQNNCNFDALNQPDVIDQCACASRVSIIADDIRTRRDDLVDDFMQSVFPGWNEAVFSCSPENQALLWMSSGINNGGEVGNLQKLQRFALALLYIRQGGTDWRSAENWMTEADVCDWQGVKCNGSNFVRILRLDRNRLSGQISDAPALLNTIEGYTATQNGMTGAIPLTFFENESLQTLDLSFNDLSGGFPRLRKDSNIKRINLASNKMSGSIPTEILNAASLESLNIEANTFSRELPNEIFDLPLQELAIGGNIFDGTIPTQLATVTTLSSISLGPNRFEDEIPTFLGELTNLKRLSITGIPALRGRLPAQYGLSLSILESFVLSGTSVAGNIPEQFSGLTGLSELRMSGNGLARAIPVSLGQLTNLVTMDLSDNDFTGTVPSSFSSLILLETLDLHTNRLVGTVPDSFGGLASLRTLTLDGNLMNGRAPEDVCALRDIQLEEFVVDCPTLTAGGQVLGIICSVPDCCTECL